MSDAAARDEGKLTDASFERARQRLGIPIRLPNPPHNMEMTWDNARRYVFGYGDDNPLYSDPGYGERTRWSGLIGAPNMVTTMGVDAGPKPTPEQKALMKGDPWAGLGSYQAVMEFEWWRPVRLGERLKKMRVPVGVVDKRSSFGGRAAHVTNDILYATEDDELVAVQRGTWINAERHASSERKKERETAEPYTAEQLAEIDACYEAETRRGAEPRYFEDVQVGDVLPTKVKGPLLTTDILLWHLGYGMGITPVGAFGISYRVRKKAPGLFPVNDLNIPDTVQRLHWEPERARQLGLPTSYDYGAMREAWLTHIVTDWMGDEGWLWKIRCEHRRFNFIGDTTWITGEVVDKRQEDGRNVVHVQLQCRNQRGVTTSPGHAVVLLPSRGAPVELPPPPVRTMEEMVRWDIERLGRQADD
ncbi:MaoC family dehydratase N-terminal domain-containing protein [Phenylobacterium sp. SCN 70-31]|uniref:FAS1-like dehydratase domain-containing protein n=1 Tax=Phenylobacterium sp. SCN 70-31 TaxID=1660129 RepID=UPI00086E89B6|nr:MaoC family dehydratase N-terminal domain-containing protein [Phenylobacterium sp. SCN 70-31]ODT88313.1 MAG: acyl dehydratase [Phenylobacterium sp. SCN 70-31]